MVGVSASVNLPLHLHRKKGRKMLVCVCVTVVCNCKSVFHTDVKAFRSDWLRCQNFGLGWTWLSLTHTHRHNHFTALLPGTTRVSQCQKNLLLDFNGAREDNRGRHTDNPAGRHSIRTNQ